MTDVTSLAVTVDVEDWYHVPAVTGSPFALYEDVDSFFAAWTRRYDYLSAPTDQILEMLEEIGIRATFFIVADVVKRYPGLVQRIAAAGHEIACHGLHHACKIHPKTKRPVMPIAAFQRRTREAKRILEDATGIGVRGYRAPAAYVSGWMLDSLEELGFAYDSSVSVNSLYNKTDSTLMEVGSSPYLPKSGGHRAFVEIPWPFLRIGARLPTAGGPFLRLFGYHYTMLGLQQSLRRGDTVFYFHPLDISEEAFPVSSTTNRPLYWAFKGNAAKRRVERVLTAFKGQTCTCGDVASSLLGEG
jgi:peptidoglycan/xylan/chitin deacetylase (PgdA/CDA1 family)